MQPEIEHQGPHPDAGQGAVAKPEQGRQGQAGGGKEWAGFPQQQAQGAEQNIGQGQGREQATRADF